MSELPSGRVTFLFTDIEGSTQLWERFPDAMPGALDRHDHILHSTIANYHGIVFRTVGDAVFAAFANCLDAFHAAVMAQQALFHEAWDVIGAIRVRMGLHTNTVELRDNAYFGPPLNRVARLMSAGHGGQTLICRETQKQVRDYLPEGVALRDMGEHLLKDLSQPEHIFQVDITGLPTEFAPLKTVTNQRTPTPGRALSKTQPLSEGYITHQHKLPGMPSVDFDAVLQKELQRRQKKRKSKPKNGLF